jgi:hypothetical protein
LNKIGEIIGYDYVLGVLLDTEKSISNSIVGARQKTNSTKSISDTAHVTILKNILSTNTKISGPNLARLKKGIARLGAMR